jgi:methyl-accepting chemotaxis protein
MAQLFKRRNIFIKKDFQGKLILASFLLVTGGCLFFIVLFALFSADTLTLSYSNHDLQLGQTPVILLKKALAAHWLFIVIGSIFLVVAVMLLTHRIAGPMFRFEKALDSMLQGRLDDTIYLRSKDEGKDLARKFNSFNEQLSTAIKSLQANSEAISALIDEAHNKSQALEGDQQLELQSLLWSLEEKNKKNQAICASYTLKDA